MKRNIIRIIVAAILVSLIALYVQWSREKARHGPRVQEINCGNNLKQIGLALRLWAGDHNEQYPFNVSTNDGGTRELNAVGQDGFALDAAIHFAALTNGDAMTTPLLLICPQAPSQKPARNFSELKPENVTYRLRVGTNISESGEKTALVTCPIDGNTLYTDGKVVETTEPGHDGRRPMSVP